MNNTAKRLTLIAAIALVVAMALPGLPQSGSVGQAQAAQAGAAQGSGEKTTLEGVILKREGDSLTVRDTRGTDTVVTITNSTQLREKKSNIFRRAKSYPASTLQRGLYIMVEGRRSGAGVQADKIRFKDDYTKLATSVEQLVVPVENRVTATETRLSESEKNAQRLSGQIQEVSAVSNAARGAAKAAQDTADQANVGIKQASDQAQNGIRVTNDRISSLDDYDVKGNTTVLFTVGSATLSKEAKADLDKLAETAGQQKGYLIEIVGFTSSEGGVAANQRLSKRRADAVVQYLAENHSIPLHRIVMPMGLGETKPVADNKTRDGRQQNRRVEITVLVNKGLTAGK
jgi:OmpA-OmpF porin, OOP family